MRVPRDRISHTIIFIIIIITLGPVSFDKLDFFFSIHNGTETRRKNKENGGRLLLACGQCGENRIYRVIRKRNDR